MVSIVICRNERCRVSHTRGLLELDIVVWVYEWFTMMVLSSFLTSCYVQILFLHGNVIEMMLMMMLMMLMMLIMHFKSYLYFYRVEDIMYIYISSTSIVEFSLQLRPIVHNIWIKIENYDVVSIS